MSSNLFINFKSWPCKYEVSGYTDGHGPFMFNKVYKEIIKVNDYLKKTFKEDFNQNRKQQNSSFVTLNFVITL